MHVARTREQLLLALPPDCPRAVVMTMGALHEGHATLLDVARREVGPQGHVLVTIFVNPLQFAAHEDLDRYPRDEAGDLALCRDRGADGVFLPTVTTVYGTRDPRMQPDDITVDPGAIGERWEGAMRPGHFRGVLTVVLKLLNLCAPDVAVFGEKDYQQLALIRRMVHGLQVPVRVVPGATIREPDGLAMSSRNRYLAPAERALAAHFPAALSAGEAAARAGAAADVVADTVMRMLSGVEGMRVDYVDITDPDLGPAPDAGPARLLAAVRIGGTRLLDNRAIDLQGVA